MDVFIGVMIALMCGAGIMQSVSNNGVYPVVHFALMMITVVGIPVLHLLS